MISKVVSGLTAAAGIVITLVLCRRNDPLKDAIKIFEISDEK